MNKKWQIKNKQHFTLICAIVFLFISLIPILLLGIYNVPGSDDYSYGALAHQAWKQSHSLFDIFTAAIKQSIDFYHRWQGTFGSCFLMSLNPGVISPTLSFLVPFIMLTLCISSTLLLFHEIFNYYLKCPSVPTITTLVILLTSFFQIMVSAKDGIYWYNGAIHYIGMQSLAFFLIYLSSLMLRTTSVPKQLLLFFPVCLLSFMVGGGNLVSALQIAVIYIFSFLYFIIAKVSNSKRLIIPFCLFVVGFVLNITAPGNSVRSTVFDELNPLVAIAASFLSAANYAIQWTNIVIILTFILILPFLCKMVKKSTYNFNKPLLIAFSSICLYAAMFTPSLYATGSVGEDRQLNIIQLSYYLLLLINTTYYIGYLQKNKSASAFTISINTILKNYSNKMVFCSFIMICFIFIFTADRTTFTSIAATRLLLNGEAKQYQAEYMQRMEILEDANTSTAYVTSFTVHPHLLSMDDDFSTDANNWLNIEGSKYFNKESIMLVESP